MKNKKDSKKILFTFFLCALFFTANINYSHAGEDVGGQCAASGGIWTGGIIDKCGSCPQGKVTGCGQGTVCQTKADYDLCIGGSNNIAASAHPEIDAGTGSVYNRPLTSGEVSSSKKFKYTLLESFPGFFSAGTAMTDLPGMILAIYKFGIWTVGIAGLFMLVVGGFMYMASAGNTSTAGNARGIIWDALLGIVAALGAYLILYVINPELTKITIGSSFVAVDISEGEDAQVSGQDPGVQAIINSKQLDAAIVDSINKINQNGVKTLVTSGLRTVETQKQLIIQNCGGFPPTKSCSPPTCLLKNGPSSCPHTTGRAVDIWALNSSGQQALSKKQCMGNINACFNNPDQKRLITAMKAEGFCVLSSEPWHFERPKMSSSCT